MNTPELRRELHRLLTILEPVNDTPRTREEARRVKEVWTTLHGNDRVFTSHPEVPWDERTEPLHRRLPEVMAWCVVKYADGRLSPDGSVWPGQAYSTRPCAELWRDFLEDYYRDVHVRDGKVRWVCERRLASVSNYSDESIPAGTGYSRDRHPWVGTLPMEVYEWTGQSEGAPPYWRRKT